MSSNLHPTGPGSGRAQENAAAVSGPETVGPAEAVVYPPTLWTVVLQAASSDDAEVAQRALGTLCQHYRPAMLAYFRKKCRDPYHAEDLTSAAIEHLLAKNRFRNFQRQPGLRFRNYLSRALKNFHADHRPAASGEPIDDYLDTQGSEVEWDKAMDAPCALVIYDRVLEALKAKHQNDDKRRRFQCLRRFILREPDSDEYATAAQDLGLEINAVRQAVFRLRAAYLEAFRAEVAETVDHLRDELDEEMKYLFSLVPKAVADRGEPSLG